MSATEAQKRASNNYYQRCKKLGLTKLLVWVPKDDVELVKHSIAQLRAKRLGQD